MEKILIEVYAGVNPNCGGGCCCSSPASPEKLKAEFATMQQTIADKYEKEIVECRFIDTTGQNLDDYPEVQKITRAGYSFPITLINGQARLASVISVEAIGKIIDEIQANSKA